MRVTQEHYTHIKTKIESLGIDKILEYQNTCLNNKWSVVRFVWDLFHFSNVLRDEVGQSREFRVYLDSHLDTAITKAVKEILGKDFKY
jgi:hypothetical protein